MEFYRVEFLISNFKESNEQESKHRQDEEAKAKEDYNPSRMASQQNSMMKQYMGNNNLGNNFKMPNMPKF